MSVSENPSTWPYPLVETSQDKRLPRVGTQAPYSAELVGVDGADQGGQRVAPGWKFTRELDFYDDEYHNASSKVTDIRIINFRIGSDDYGYGVVYRATRATTISSSTGHEDYDAADVFVDFYNSRTGTWSTGNKLMDNVSATAPFDATSTGRLVYAFVQGRSPARFYIRDDESFHTLGRELTDALPGPGVQPELVSPMDVVTPLGTLSPPSDTDQPARGQVVLTLTLPSASGLFTEPSTADSTDSSSGKADDNFQDDDAFKLEYGDYVFSYQLFNSETGQWSALSSIAQCRGRDFNLLPGDSTSSDGTDNDFRDHYAAMEIVWDATEFDTAFIYRSVKVQDAGGTFVAAIQQLDNIITLDDFRTISQPANNRYNRAVYYYQLEDKQLLYQAPYLDQATFDEQLPKGGTVTWYENTLIVGSVREGGTDSSPGVNRPFDRERGLGEIRWSSLTRYAPELFPPSHRYAPKVPNNEVKRLLQVGGNCLGFSADRMYHTRKESVYLRTSEMHEGFGIVAPRAGDVTGTFAYFVSHKGLKAVDSVGQLDDVNSMNNIVVNEWVGQLDNISCAFDPYMGAFFVLNPDTEETVILWMNTGKVTEMADAVFTQCDRGPWPENPVDWDDTLTERAVFVQNSPDLTIEIDNWKPRLYVWDSDRAKVISGSTSDDGKARISTLDPNGDVRFGVTGYSSTTGNISLTAGSLGAENRLTGCKVYIIESDNEANIGSSATIQDVVVNALRIVSADRATFPLQPTDRIAISPVKFRWVGAPVVRADSFGNQFGGNADFWQIKHIDRLGASFSDVSGAAVDDSANVDDKYRGLVYLGNNEAVLQSAFPRTNNDSLMNSVQDNEPVEYAFFGAEAAALRGRYGVQGFSLAPGIEVLASDLDFRLLGVLVEGRIVGSRTSSRRA